MIPVAAKLFFGAVWKRLLGLFGWIGDHPWQAALIVALCVCGWLYHGRQDARQELADVRAAQKAATGAQKRVNDAAQAHYERKADEADTRHDASVADARTDTDRFIASRRVQPKDRTCQAPAAAPSADPGVPPEVPPGIVVDQADVHACAALYAYSSSAHAWAQSLKLPESLLPEQ